MKTYYVALIILWLCWDCNLNPASEATSVKPNLFELKTAPPPITTAAADTITRIAAVPACPVHRLP